MGTDYRVDVGPVIVINNPPVDTFETHIGCCNESCNVFHKYANGAKFCSVCGSPIQEWVKAVVKPKKINCYDLFKDVIVPSNFEHQDAPELILIANIRGDEVGFQHFNLKYEPFQVFPKIEDIAGDIKKFEAMFVNELTTLKEIFGETNVTVRYGVIGTISC